MSAWIALYRAAGGSWDGHENARKVDAASASVPSNGKPEKPDQLLNHQIDFSEGKS